MEAQTDAVDVLVELTGSQFSSGQILMAGLFR